MSVMLKCLSHTPLRDYNDPDKSIVKEIDDVIARARAEVEAFDPELIVRLLLITLIAPISLILPQLLYR